MKRLYGEHGRRRIFKEGRLQDLPSEVRQLWHSRNDDLPELPSVGVQEQYMGDGWEDAEQAQLIQIVSNVMAEALTKREFAILTLRFVHDMTLDEIANATKVTRERVRQIEAKALRRLKHPNWSDRLRALMPWFGWAEISNPPVDVYGTPFYFKPEKKTPTKQAEQHAEIKPSTLGKVTFSRKPVVGAAAVPQPVDALVRAMEKHERLAEQAKLLREWHEAEAARFESEQHAKRANGGYEQWWLDLMEKEAKSAT